MVNKTTRRNAITAIVLTTILFATIGVALAVYTYGFESARSQHQFRLVAWNVESGGNDPNLIAEQIKDFSDCGAIALNEVNSKNVDKYATALGSQFKTFVSKTGRADRLAILYNVDEFELLESKELASYREHELNNGNHRSPIFVRLRQKTTGLELMFMTNHLARGNAKLRQAQAVGLREWARDSSSPIIAMGDFNFDYDFHTKTGNEAFKLFLRDNVWKWVKPEQFIDTNWADRDQDGKDNYPDSMLDFAFVANGATNFDCTCRVIKRDNDFPDGERQSDHRAIELIVRPTKTQ